MKKSPAAISIYFHQKLLIIKKLDSFKNIRCYIWIPWVKMHIGTKFYYCSIYRTWVIKKNRISIFLRKGLWLQTKYFFSQKLLRVGVSNHQRFLLLYVSVCTVKEKQIKNFWYHFFHFLDVLIWTDSTVLPPTDIFWYIIKKVFKFSNILVPSVIKSGRKYFLSNFFRKTLKIMKL